MLRKREGMDIFPKNMDRIVKAPYNGVLAAYVYWKIGCYWFENRPITMLHRWHTTHFLRIIGNINR